jgi:protein required for attachment to host cells
MKSKLTVKKLLESERTWVLIANAERARCFERHDSDHSLTELADFVHPNKRLTDEPQASDLTGAAGKGHGRTGHAGTQFEPHTEAHAKQEGAFALQLAEYLNKGIANKQCHALVLIASSPMLGELRPRLSQTAQMALKNSIVSDLTSYQGVDLKQRVSHALRLPDH